MQGRFKPEIDPPRCTTVTLIIYLALLRPGRILPLRLIHAPAGWPRPRPAALVTNPIPCHPGRALSPMAVPARAWWPGGRVRAKAGELFAADSTASIHAQEAARQT